MAHTHTFDPFSGWCGRCGLRDDGRLVDRNGVIIRPGPEYNADQLATMLTPAQNGPNR